MAESDDARQHGGRSANGSIHEMGAGARHLARPMHALRSARSGGEIAGG